MMSSLKTFVTDAYQVLGWRLPVLLGATLLSAVLEGLMVAALLPLLAKAGGQGMGQNVGTDKVSRAFDTILPVLGLPPTVGGIAVIVVALIAASGAVFLVQAYASFRLQTRYVATWQQRLFAAYFAADYAFFRSRRSADLISAALNEPQRLGWAFYQANLIATCILFITIQVIIALFIAPAVVALLLAAGVALFALTRALVSRAVVIGTQLTQVNADLQAEAGELIAGAKFVKATATEPRALERLDPAVRRLQHLTFANNMDVQIVRAVFEYASGLLVVFLLAMGPSLFAVEVGSILVIVAMFVRLFPKVTALRQCMQSISVALPAYDAVADLLAAAVAAREEDGRQPPPGWRSRGSAAIQTRRLAVAEGGQTILSDVSLDIPAGALVAIVGPTGAGKTTLLDCILGLRQPTTGKVSIDGHDLVTIPAGAWRRGIGYLGQDPILFNASIADNLRWIKPDTTPAELDAALAMASADFVTRLPEGAATNVGDRGARLSGGERQRLALARALLGRPRLLVLDEATSALDSVTEQSVVDTIASLKGQLTIIAITHRPALLAVADAVVEMRDGRIVSIRRPVTEASDGSAQR